MPYKVIKANKAPEKPTKKQVSKSAAYFREIIRSLNGDDVAVVEPEPGQSQRGIKVSIGRVASSLGVKVDSWSVDDDPNVYVQLSAVQQARLPE